MAFDYHTLETLHEGLKQYILCPLDGDRDHPLIIRYVPENSFLDRLDVIHVPQKVCTLR